MTRILTRVASEPGPPICEQVGVSASEQLSHLDRGAAVFDEIVGFVHEAVPPVEPLSALVRNSDMERQSYAISASSCPQLDIVEDDAGVAAYWDAVRVPLPLKGHVHAEGEDKVVAGATIRVAVGVRTPPEARRPPAASQVPA